MKNGFLNWKQAIASAMVLAALIVVSAGPVPAAKIKEPLSKKEVKQLVASAKTAEDHLTLARYYTAMAEKHEADSRAHEAMAAMYRRNPTASESKRPMAPDTAAHCDYFAEHCRKEAQKMRAEAAKHEEQAKALAK